MTKWKMVTINLDERRHAELSKIAAFKNMSKAEFLRYLIDLYLKEHGQVKELLKRIEEIEATQDTP